MITTSDEAWATDTLRDAQDPGAGKQSWPPVTRITLERYNLIFAQRHSRGYGSTGQPQHDAATCLENSKAILVKVALVSGGLLFTKWSVANGLQYDDVEIVANADISDTARPSVELTAGTQATIRVFYVDEDDDEICYKESSDGGNSFGAEVSVGAQANLKAIASTSPTKVHCVSYASGNSRFHFFEYDGSWAETNSLIYWPHEIEHIDAITIGDRDLVVFYSLGPLFGKYREAGIYGIWVEHGRWSDIFKIDVLDEADSYAYRQHPMISTANGIYFLTGYLSEGDEDYSHATRSLKMSKDGQGWSQYMPLVTCPEAGPAKLLVINAAAGESWPWDTGQQVYLVGYDKVYESDATRLVGEINAALQVNVKSRTRGWQLQRGVISQGNTILSNHDGALDAHAIINANNTLLLKREAGYRTGAGDEYAQITLETVDFIKETDELPQRHKQVVSRDFMAWVRDREADHFECWESQLVGYDNYQDDTETGYGGLGHTATQEGWWETANNQLWLRSDNKEGVAFATWDSRIMCGQARARVRIETAGNGEYAGVVFHAKDADNFWAAYYDEGADRIYLRQKVDGTWQSAVAQSAGALGWDIDYFYGIMVDFRYSYVRVFRSTDGATWTQDFTYICPATDSDTVFEYGYVGLLGYGYSDQDTDEDAGYTPDAEDIVDQSPSDGGTINTQADGNIVYVVGADGHLYRTRNALAASINVVWEDLGDVTGGASNPGAWWIALDPFDPKNKAMVCGNFGVRHTSNLDDEVPTWKVVRSFDLATRAATQIIPSEVTKDLWYWVEFSTVPSNNGVLCRTTDSGDSWGAVVGLSVTIPYLELSIRDSDKGWVTEVYNAVFNEIYAYDIETATHNDMVPPLGASEGPVACHHRLYNNSDDGIAVWGGHDWSGGMGHTPQVVLCTGDYGVCGVKNNLPMHDDQAGIYQIGSYRNSDDQWWTLSGPKYINGTPNYEAQWMLCKSEDGEVFVETYDFGNYPTQLWVHVEDWRYNKDRFYACQTSGGATAPLLVSTDGGDTFVAKLGNWATLGVGDPCAHYCCAVVWEE